MVSVTAGTPAECPPTLTRSGYRFWAADSVAGDRGIRLHDSA